MNLVLHIVLVVILAITNVSSFRNLLSPRRTSVSVMSATELSPDAKFQAVKDQVDTALNAKVAAGATPEKFAHIVKGFINEYGSTYMESNESPEQYQYFVSSLLKFVLEAIDDPYMFESYHQAIREPFDYYKWGNDFMRPLVDMSRSRMVGEENLRKLIKYKEEGHNIIVLANHQTEVDPQAISILLEEAGMGDIAEEMIFIAGHKVTNDPVAIPFSMGRNLICIHSKKHIKNPPEEFPRKQAQNMESMKSLGDLLSEGGKIIWLAPSGGRDRPDESGKFVVAPFDVKSLDMFKLMAMQSNNPMHFFPMAMYTNKLVPPPDAAATAELGETRSAKRGPVSIFWLPETDGLGGLKDKVFSSVMEADVIKAYNELCAWHEAG